MLAIARLAADLIVRDFLRKGSKYTPGHEEIEIALLRLYRITGNQPYLDMARRFLERRGHTPLFGLSLLRQNASARKRRKIIAAQRQEYLTDHPEHAAFQLPPGNEGKAPADSKRRWQLSALSGKYFQQHAPIRRQNIPVGHAVRFGYLETATAMLHRLTGDKTLLPALQQAWERMVTRRMYVTGGIGAVPGLEGFGNDYELDPEYAYAETCAALASIFWNWEMALITGEARYSDLLEWQLYNAAAVGMGLNGENYLYNNPLACRGGVRRQAWYVVPCCPSNLSRTWADLGKYIYSTGEKSIWIHQYIGSLATLEPGAPVTVEMESGLPWEGLARVRINPAQALEFTLHLRLPAWGVKPHVSLNGAEIGTAPVPPKYDFTAAAQGYDPRWGRFLPITRLWNPGDMLELTLDMPIILRTAHDKVQGHAGKAAVTRGPLVYCLESVDNPGVDIFSARLDPASLRPEPAPDLLGGVTILRGQAVGGQSLTFIPYHLWANRGGSQMNVWVPCG
jgi:hypothetical protein